MTEQMYDRQWYRRKVADPDTGEARRFIGGGLSSVDFDLDALYYGVEHENERRKREAEVRAVCCLVSLLVGHEVDVAPQAALLDTTAWLDAFDVLWSPENIPSHLDPSTAVNFRLDVLRAMASLPKSWKRALLHAMDGYSAEEVADLMGWTKEVARIDEAAWQWLPPRVIPNVESAERVIRNASSKVRQLGAFDMPGKQKRKPRPGALDTSVITDVEAEITEVREWRRRELRRRELTRRERAKEAA